PVAGEVAPTWVACNLAAGSHAVNFYLASSLLCASPNPAISNSITVVAETCTGMEENNTGPSLNISFNPDDGILSVHFNSYSYPARLVITNAMGEIIYEQNISTGKQ